MQFLRSSSGGCNTSTKNKFLRDRGADALSKVTKKTVSGSLASYSSNEEDDEKFMEEARRYNAPKHFMLKGMGEAADAVSCSTSSCESESIDDEHASSDDEDGENGSTSSRTSSNSNGHEEEEEEEDESTTSSSDDDDDDEESTDSGEDSYEDEEDDNDEDEDDDEETRSEGSLEGRKKHVAAKISKKHHKQQQQHHGRHLVAPRRKRLGGGSAHICSPSGTHEDGIPLMVQINTTEDSLCGESQTTLSTQLGSIDKSGSTLRRRSTAPSDASRTRSEGRTSFIEPVDETCATSSRGNSVQEGQEPPFLDFSGRRPTDTNGIPVGGTTPGGSLASSISASASALRSAADLSTTSPFKKYTTASGLPPSCQLRDAQFLKLNFPESHWAPDIHELEHLEALMNVQCTLICSYDPSIRESFWVCLMKVMKKRRANGISQICIGYVKQDLRCCDLPRGSQIVLLPKHIQKVDSKSSDILFQKLIAAEQKQKEMTRIRPVLPGGGPHLPGDP